MKYWAKMCSRIFGSIEMNWRIDKKSVNVNPTSFNPIKWSNTLKQFVEKLPTNCLSEFDHFVGLALKGLSSNTEK